MNGRTHKAIGCIVFGCLAWIGSAAASPMVYEPTNPSFGGSPFAGSHLAGIAAAQRDFPRPSTQRSGLSASELFVRQLQNRLLSELSTRVFEAIFGDEPQDSGEITFGDQTIIFERGLESILLRIINTATGEETEITVPLLQIGGP